MELPIQAPQLVKEDFQTGNLKILYLSTYGPELKLLPETFLKVTQQAAQHYKTWKLVLKMLFTEPEGTYPTVGLTSIMPASGIYYPIWKQTDPVGRNKAADLIQQKKLLETIDPNKVFVYTSTTFLIFARTKKETNKWHTISFNNAKARYASGNLPMTEATAQEYCLFSKRGGIIHQCKWCQYHKVAELCDKAEKEKLKQLAE